MPTWPRSRSGLHGPDGRGSSIAEFLNAADAHHAVGLPAPAPSPSASPATLAQVARPFGPSLTVGQASRVALTLLAAGR